MNEQMMKSLVALIDESLAEIEELKKSDRFSASECDISGPGEGIAGKPSNGHLGKDDDDDDDEKKVSIHMDKDEGKNREADPNGGHHEMDKSEGSPMYAGAADGSSHGSAAGVNREADPNGGHHVAKADEENKKKNKKDKDEAKNKDEDATDDDDGDDDDDKKKQMPWMKKSIQESNSLLKSYVDERLAPIEGKLESIMALVQQVADAPVAQARGSNYRTLTPLVKSSDEGEMLTKSSVVNKLFELKKSGTRVDSVDIASAELGGNAELAKIVNKYNIK